MPGPVKAVMFGDLFFSPFIQVRMHDIFLGGGVVWGYAVHRIYTQGNGGSCEPKHEGWNREEL